MNRTHEVAQLVYSTSRKDFTHIGADIDYTTPLLEHLAPIVPCRSTLSAFGGEAAVSRSRALGLHPCWQKQQSMFPTNSSSEISASPYPTSIGLDPKIPVSRGKISFLQ